MNVNQHQENARAQYNQLIQLLDSHKECEDTSLPCLNEQITRKAVTLIKMIVEENHDPQLSASLASKISKIPSIAAAVQTAGLLHLPSFSHTAVACLESAMALSAPDQRAASLSSWAADHIPSLDRQVLHSLNSYHLLMLIDNLSQSQAPFPTHNQKVLEEIHRMEIYKTHSALKENTPPSDLFTAFQGDYDAIAYHIATRKVPIKSLEATEEQLLLLAPHLRYADLRGLSTSLVEKLLEKTTTLHTLNVSGTSISRLSENLASLKNLNCSNCQQLTELPSKLSLLEKLDCSNCKNLENLPEGMSALEILCCSWCAALQVLPSDMGQLKKLKCSDCEKLRALPKGMTALQALYASGCPCLTSFPEGMINLLKLICFDCENLRTLPTDMTALQALYVSDCPRLKFLPEGMINLLKLECSDCEKLKSIPSDLRSLKKLWCFGCPRLEYLPSGMTNLVRADFSDCERLKILSTDMQALQRLIISSCPRLTSLPGGMINLLKLDCSDCDRLTSIPQDLYALRKLNCSRCIMLQQLPLALPSLQYLDCSGNESLELLTEEPLPQLAYVNLRGCTAFSGQFPLAPVGVRYILVDGREFYQFSVKLEDLAHSPKQVLVTLAQHYSLTSKVFPHIKYYENEKPVASIDAGGLQRDFFRRIAEQIFGEDSPNGTHLFLQDGYPAMGVENNDTNIAYQTLGKLLGLCYLPSSTCQIGDFFKTEVYQALTFMPARHDVSDADWVVSYQKMLSEAMRHPAQVQEMRDFIHEPTKKIGLSSESMEFMSNFIWDLEGKSLAEEIANKSIQIRDEMVSEAKTYGDGRLRALNLLACGMRSILGDKKWEALCAEKPNTILEKIEGVLTKDRLKAKVVWKQASGVSDIDLENAKQFFSEWLETAEMPQLRQVVRAACGNSGLGKDSLTFEVTAESSDRLPMAHTCFFSIHFPAYKSAAQFKNKFEFFIATDGFELV